MLLQQAFQQPMPRWQRNWIVRDPSIISGFTGLSGNGMSCGSGVVMALRSARAWVGNGPRAGVEDGAEKQTGRPHRGRPAITSHHGKSALFSARPP